MNLRVFDLPYQRAMFVLRSAVMEGTMDQDDLASLSISEIAQQLAALAATLRQLAETPVFDEPANDDAIELVN